MPKKLYYSVVEDYQGVCSISSLLGETKARERKYALTLYRRCHGVYTTLEEAQDRLRKIQPSPAH